MGKVPPDDVLDIIGELGLRTRFDRAEDGVVGFPASIPLADGRVVEIETSIPLGLDTMNPEAFGVIVVDPLGYVLKTWGLAETIDRLRSNRSLLDSPLGPLIQAAKRGRHATVYVDGKRFHNSIGSAVGDLTLVVIDAADEAEAEVRARRADRAANALRRLGRALTMDPRIEALCTTVAHEIASSLELAATLIWISETDRPALDLVASVGVNRFGVSAVKRLSANGGDAAAAEWVAESRKPFDTDDVDDHALTTNLEARFCYLKPGAVSVFPLVNSGKLLGVIEFVGRDDDRWFASDRDLFQTIADHVALALNSAMLLNGFERLALHDPLTGLPNHRALHDFLEKRLLESVRRDEPVGVAMIDVDHFRAFNEEEGHEAGDNVLRLVADALKSCLRPYDLPARYGGEEFTIVMPGAPKHALLAAAERIREKIAAIPYKTRAGRSRSITVSIGCSAFPDTAFEAATLLRAADEALYRAKRSGRNRVEWFEGAYEGDSVVHQLHFDFGLWLGDACPEGTRRAAADLIERHHGWLDQLGLSPSQRRLLEALVQIAPYYLRSDGATRQKMLDADELRTLAPNLAALEERYDSKGDSAPILARVYAVLEALETSIDALNADPGRFDPEIAEIAARGDRAA